LLAHGTSTTKTGHHDVAEILLKVALSTINQIKSFNKDRIVLQILKKTYYCKIVLTTNPRRIGDRLV
jgi:dihydropteroate synthase